MPSSNQASPAHNPNANKNVSDLEAKRLERTTVLPGWDAEKVAQTHVAIVGSGGLGSPLLLGLVASGIGRITLYEHDTIELHNLNRQILYSKPDVGQPKAETAKKKLQALGDTTIDLAGTFEPDTRIDADIMIDASDNFRTRYLIADASLDMPCVWGSVLQYGGQVGVFPPGHSLRDLYPEPPSNPPSNAIGVLGPVAHVIGSMMAVETLKLALDLGQPAQLSVYDALSATTKQYRLR